MPYSYRIEKASACLLWYKDPDPEFDGPEYAGHSQWHLRPEIREWLDRCEGTCEAKMVKFETVDSIARVLTWNPVIYFSNKHDYLLYKLQQPHLHIDVRSRPEKVETE